MSQIDTEQRVYEIMLAIQKHKYLIPSIQRGYEWKEDRVLKLLDSIMSGYPINAMLVWKPSEEIWNDIPNREFPSDFDSAMDYLSDTPHLYDDGAYLVLDGQQRLQSLYISFFGSYNKKRVYFQVDYIPILTLHFKNFIEPIGCKSDLQTGIPESGFPAI